MRGYKPKRIVISCNYNVFPGERDELARMIEGLLGGTMFTNMIVEVEVEDIEDNGGEK